MLRAMRGAHERHACATVRRSTLAGLSVAVALAIAGCAASNAGSPAPSSAAASPSATSQVLSATSRPTPQAKPSVDPNALAVKITAHSKTAKRGGVASVTIKTTAGAECGISVLYPDGPSSAKGLDPAKADKKGTIVWKWTVASTVRKGTWPINVSCSIGDRTGEAATNFTVK
jgi:hypothetical protein